MSDLVDIKAGPHAFVGRLEAEKAPRTVEHFLGMLPYENKILQARWSGFAAWGSKWTSAQPLIRERTVLLLSTSGPLGVKFCITI